MRIFLWSLILKYFRTELKAYADRFKMEHYRDVHQDKEAERTYINYPKGRKVILRSNEPGELVIGPIVGYEECHNRVFLQIHDEKTGKIIMSLDNNPAYWNPSREKALRKLDWCEQWNAMTKYDTEMDEEHQKYKESPEYLTQTHNFKSE